MMMMMIMMKEKIRKKSNFTIRYYEVTVYIWRAWISPGVGGWMGGGVVRVVWLGGARRGGEERRKEIYNY